MWYFICGRNKKWNKIEETKELLWGCEIQRSSFCFYIGKFSTCQKWCKGGIRNIICPGSPILTTAKRTKWSGKSFLFIIQSCRRFGRKATVMHNLRWYKLHKVKNIHLKNEKSSHFSLYFMKMYGIIKWIKVRSIYN